MIMKLNRFHSFNEAANPDLFKLDQNSVYVLNSDACVSVVFDGSDIYTLKIFGDRQVCELTCDHIEPIVMTYDEVSSNKEKITNLEPTPKEGELLYKWIARNLAVIEWSNSSIVSDWQTFESQSDFEPLGSTERQSPYGHFYTLTTTFGIFGLEILRDLSTFKLITPHGEGAIIGTRVDLFQNSDYYKGLAAPDTCIYCWIESCLNILSHPDFNK